VTVVITLTGYQPPARYDELPWTIARIQQASTETGSYTLVEDVTLDPVDTDPSQPQTRSFTTELGTAGDWFRVVWVDGDGDLSDPTDPVQQASGVAAYADATELAAILKVNATTNADALDRVLLAAAGEIDAEIGRTDLAGWEVALAAEVNLERAVEHWQQLKSPFGIIGLGGAELLGATHIARDSWDRHAHKLAPLKRSWGIA
jgi:hypothetical protein